MHMHSSHLTVALPPQIRRLAPRNAAPPTRQLQQAAHALEQCLLQRPLNLGPRVFLITTTATTTAPITPRPPLPLRRPLEAEAGPFRALQPRGQGEESGCVVIM